MYCSILQTKIRIRQVILLDDRSLLIGNEHLKDHKPYLLPKHAFIGQLKELSERLELVDLLGDKQAVEKKLTEKFEQSMRGIVDLICETVLAKIQLHFQFVLSSILQSLNKLELRDLESLASRSFSSFERKTAFKDISEKTDEVLNLLYSFRDESTNISHDLKKALEDCSVRYDAALVVTAASGLSDEIVRMLLHSNADEPATDVFLHKAEFPSYILDAIQEEVDSNVPALQAELRLAIKNEQNRFNQLDQALFDATYTAVHFKAVLVHMLMACKSDSRFKSGMTQRRLKWFLASYDWPYYHQSMHDDDERIDITSVSKCIYASLLKKISQRMDKAKLSVGDAAAIELHIFESSFEDGFKELLSIVFMNKIELFGSKEFQEAVELLEASDLPEYSFDELIDKLLPLAKSSYQALEQHLYVSMLPEVVCLDLSAVGTRCSLSCSHSPQAADR